VFVWIVSDPRLKEQWINCFRRFGVSELKSPLKFKRSISFSTNKPLRTTPPLLRESHTIMVTITLASEYAYVRFASDQLYSTYWTKQVIGTGVLSAFVMQYLGIKVGGARKVSWFCIWDVMSVYLARVDALFRNLASPTRICTQICLLPKRTKIRRPLTAIRFVVLNVSAYNSLIP
jgi:hypothetical protein